MRNAVLLLCLVFLAANSLFACAAVNSDYVPPVLIAAPDLEAYGPEFQARMADELEAMPEACDRIDPNPTCSAIARAVMDYGKLRDQVRAMEGGQ
jgi:hypothetical protein